MASDNRSAARMLVIEDEETLRNLLEEWLKAGGFQVKAVDSYRAALGALALQTFDLIITDTMDFIPPTGYSPGLEALRQTAKGTPVVLFTGYQEAAGLSLMDLGLSAICQKPYFEELRAAIRMILDRRIAGLSAR